jgi:hypothetical protein
MKPGVPVKHAGVAAMVAAGAGEDNFTRARSERVSDEARSVSQGVMQ